MHIKIIYWIMYMYMHRIGCKVPVHMIHIIVLISYCAAVDPNAAVSTSLAVADATDDCTVAPPSAAQANKENVAFQPPLPPPPSQAVFKATYASSRPRGGQRMRTKSLVANFGSTKRTPRNNRNSLLLRHLSPEEGSVVLCVTLTLFDL